MYNVRMGRKYYGAHSLCGLVLLCTVFIRRIIVTFHRTCIYTISIYHITTHLRLGGLCYIAIHYANQLYTA